MNQQEKVFIRTLAEYLAGPAHVGKSLELQMDISKPITWRTLLNTTPLRDYPTVDEAEVELTKFLE